MSDDIVKILRVLVDKDPRGTLIAVIIAIALPYFVTFGSEILRSISSGRFSAQIAEMNTRLGELQSAVGNLVNRIQDLRVEIIKFFTGA